MNSYDLVCVGSGPGGLTAALTAAKKGRKVLLIERNEYPGGSLVTGAGLAGPKEPPENFPRTRELLEFLRRKGAIGEPLPWCNEFIFPTNPDLLKLAALQFCEENGVETLFCTQPSEVLSVNGKAERIVCFGKGRRTVIAAGAFIDGTGRNTLLQSAGETVPSASFQDLSLTALFFTDQICISDLFRQENVLDITDWVRHHTEIPVSHVFLQKALEAQRVALQLIEQKNSDPGYENQLNTISADMYHLFLALREKYTGFRSIQISRVSPCLSVSAKTLSDSPVTDLQKISANPEKIQTRTSVKGLFRCGQLVPVYKAASLPFIPAICCMMTGEAAGIAATTEVAV